MVTMPVRKGFVVTSGFGPRWGAFHWGTDYGVVGGAGGAPIYAVKSGKVLAAGPAQGFGRWIRIDHPASVGGWESVYGHIIPEVRAGQQVSEGQRIGRIDPNSATNGGVAPHLHLEIHRYSWVAHANRVAGSNILDPHKALQGAKWPARHQRESTTMFGIDISEHQNGLSLALAKAEGLEFVIIRLCDGTYKDKVFRSHLDDAEKNGMIVSTYWYLRAPSEGSTIKQQVDVIDQQMAGRRDLGVWIDVESVSPSGVKLLTKDDVWQAKKELESRGYHVPGIYSGAWYWEKMPGGEPSMKGLGNLWVSNYGRNASGIPYVLYDTDGGDNHKGWSYPLGDRKPDILQFGSNGNVAGFKSVDINAFKGTAMQLKAMFYRPGSPAGTPTKDNQTTKEESMSEDLKRQLDRIEKNQIHILRQLGQPGGWEQGGSRTLYDLTAAVAEKEGVPGTRDTMKKGD